MTLQLFKWDTLEAEFLRLALRTLTAGVCWWLLRDVIESRTVRPEGLTKRPFLISVALLLGAALTMPHSQLSPLFAVLFGVGSIAVAFLMLLGAVGFACFRATAETSRPPATIAGQVA